MPRFIDTTFSRSRTPEDKEPEFECKGCHVGFYSVDDLSKKGYCASCCENAPHQYYCDNCYNDWCEIGIPPECPQCHTDGFYSEDPFIDGLINEKRNNIPAKKFGAVLMLALILFGWNLFAQSKPDTTVSTKSFIQLKESQMEAFRTWAQNQLVQRQSGIDQLKQLKNDSLTVSKKEFGGQ